MASTDPIIMPQKMISRVKTFSNATLAGAEGACNTFIGTLDADGTKSYSSQVVGSYWDSAQHNIVLQYSYPIET